MGGVCAPLLPSCRERLWRSVPLGPVARVAVFQVAACSVLFSQAEPRSLSRLAVVLAGCIGFTALPLARLGAALSRDHPRVYWWAGRVWTTAVPLFMTLTIPDAYDGTGVVFAERATTPFVMAAVIGLSFAIGAQGALLGVPIDALVNMVALMLGMAALKLHHAYTPAYMALHGAFLGALALGYVCVSKYADLRESEREAAETVVRVAAAVNQPYVVTDSQLTILAVNQRFCEVLGYDADEVYGKPVSTLLEQDVDASWVIAVLSKEEKEHVWSVVPKDGTTRPVRITLGETRCPINGTTFYWAKFASMALEQRNQQLTAEKERLAWDLATSQCHECEEKAPRQYLGVRVAEGTHHTLGAMQDQRTTDDAVSNAHSFDHVVSNVSPALPPRPASPLPSITSLQSSVMDTVSQAAAKDPTRAPPPTKPKSRLPRPKTTRSEPSARKPKAGNNPKTPKRAVPLVERLGPDPREDC